MVGHKAASDGEATERDFGVMWSTLSLPLHQFLFLFRK